MNWLYFVDGAQMDGCCPVVWYGPWTSWTSVKPQVCICVCHHPVHKKCIVLQRCNTQKLEKLIFVSNVGKESDGSVYFSLSQRWGYHWVLIIVELTNRPTILYCDSLTWRSPNDLLSVISLYTAPFSLLSLDECNLCILHDPLSIDRHFCNVKCRSNPLQTCSNVCGVVALICAVVDALDSSLYAIITGSRCGLQI